MIVPLLMVFLAGAFFDTSPIEEGQTVNGSLYLMLTITRVVGVTMVLVFFWSSIRKTFSLEVDHWGWIAGVVGIFLWLGVCSLSPEKRIIGGLGFSTEWLEVRDAVNPFTTYSGPTLVTFLTVRFLLLACCIPVAEELFLRGFVMRAVESDQWHEFPISKIGWEGWVAATIYAVLTHPGEAVAAALWFGMITFLMAKTGKFWNCVLAHAVTNLLLGIYVCYYGAWHLW